MPPCRRFPPPLAGVAAPFHGLLELRGRSAVVAGGARTMQHSKPARLRMGHDAYNSKRGKNGGGIKSMNYY